VQPASQMRPWSPRRIVSYTAPRQTLSAHADSPCSCGKASRKLPEMQNARLTAGIRSSTEAQGEENTSPGRNYLERAAPDDAAALFIGFRPQSASGR
jgi:hypothetical protein